MLIMVVLLEMVEKAEAEAVRIINKVQGQAVLLELEIQMD